jgi:hypothetical protein
MEKLETISGIHYSSFLRVQGGGPQPPVGKFSFAWVMRRRIGLSTKSASAATMRFMIAAIMNTAYQWPV